MSIVDRVLLNPHYYYTCLRVQVTIGELYANSLPMKPSRATIVVAIFPVTFVRVECNDVSISHALWI